MSAPDFREALAERLRADPRFHGPHLEWDIHTTRVISDAVLALLAERLGGDEVREVVLKAIDDYEQGVDSLDATSQAEYADAALAALRDHLGVTR